MSGVHGDTPVVAPSTALHELGTAIESCTSCRLANTRKRACVGTIVPGARVLVVLDAPRYVDDRTPLDVPVDAPQGDEEAVVAAAAIAAGLAPNDIAYAWAVRCRPPGARPATADELAACEAHLFRQVELLKPEVVIAAGVLAARLITGLKGGLDQLRGDMHSVSLGATTIPVIPTYPPGAAPYTEQLHQQFTSDFARAAQLVMGDVAVAANSSDIERSADEAEEMRLFTIDAGAE